MMNIYKVERTDSVDYDEYDSFVIIAETESVARYTHPAGYDIEDAARGSNSWPVLPEDIIVTLIGRSAGGIPAGVICVSFNAG